LSNTFSSSSSSSVNRSGCEILDEMLCREANEYFLFHGMHSDHVGQIAANGFQVVGHEHMYGSGVYFSESSTKADEYTGEKVWSERGLL